MTTIRATCPACGDIQLSVRDVSVRICADDNRSSYCFLCPTCGFGVAKDADQRIVDLLVSSGVRMDVWHVPDELLEEKDGPAFSHDDLLDFHLLLEGDAWFERVQRLVTDSGTQ